MADTDKGTPTFEDYEGLSLDEYAKSFPRRGPRCLLPAASGASSRTTSARA